MSRHFTHTQGIEANEVIIVLPPPPAAHPTIHHTHATHFAHTTHSAPLAAAACKHIVAILSGAMTVFTF